MRCSLWEKEGDFTDYFSPLSKKKDLFNKWNREYLFIRPTTRDDAVGSKKSLLWIFILALKPSERLLTREILSAFQKGLVNWSAWSHLINNNQRCQRWAISFRLERRSPPHTPNSAISYCFHQFSGWYLCFFPPPWLQLHGHISQLARWQWL